MATYLHPASLSPLQQYRQARAILRNTSRASNPAWYQEALELNHQLHIRPDGQGVSTYYYDRKSGIWSEGPPLAEDSLEDPEKLASFISEILRFPRSKGANSLGVILHIADEFATNELKSEMDNPGALADLRDAAALDPASILEDSSINPSQASWRVLPYPAAGSDVIGTTVTLSQRYSVLLAALRDAAEKERFPIITQALSAPLVALLGIAQWIEPTPDKPFVAILQYPWFTLLAFFNEKADLRLIRTLQHKGQRNPRFFRRNALATTSASLEFLDPDLFIIPLSQNADRTLEQNLRTTFSSSRVEVVKPRAAEGVPEWCQEPVIAANAITSEPPQLSHTFNILHKEKWALQDFFPTPKEVAEIYPRRSEMRLLRLLRLARVAIFLVALLGLTHFGYGTFQLMRSNEWKFDPSKAQAEQGRLAALNTERQKIDHWSNLLQDRSKAWVAMESLSRMFPENAGMLVKNFNHSIKIDSSPGQMKVGFVREWKITGFVRDEALAYLNTLNTREGISAHFAEIARTTGNPSFDPNTGNRSITVNIRTQENKGFKLTPAQSITITDETTYPFTFDMTISQRFEATDPLAVIARKAP